MKKNTIPEIKGNLRNNFLEVPSEINQVNGIKIFGKSIKSIVFSTDVAIIKNVNADAILAVYPFTPQPIITQAVIMAADVPVFSGIGGCRTFDKNRVLNLALHAEFQGAIGVVLNATVSNELVESVAKKIDIPVVVTIASHKDDINGRIDAGALILNVSASVDTPFVVDKIKSKYPNMAVIATGGPTSKTVIDTINAGADAITWTPPTTGELFKPIMTYGRNKFGIGKYETVISSEDE